VLFEMALEAGAEDMKRVDDHYEITTAVESFDAVRKALEDGGVAIASSELTRIPQSTVQVEEKHAKSLLRLMDELEDHDDVQKSYSNFDISDEVLAALAEAG